MVAALAIFGGSDHLLCIGDWMGALYRVQSGLAGIPCTLGHYGNNQPTMEAPLCACVGGCVRCVYVHVFVYMCTYDGLVMLL